MAWRTIASTETDPGAPGTSELFKALADNPKGLADGAAGAPPVRTAALKSPAAGTTHLIMRLQETEQTTNSFNYVSTGFHNRYSAGQHLGVTVLVAGTITCSLEHKADDAGGQGANVRILKNGAQVIEWSTTNTSYVSREVNVSVSVGDAIIFQSRSDGADFSVWNNLRIYSANPDMAVA